MPRTVGWAAAGPRGCWHGGPGTGPPLTILFLQCVFAPCLGLFLLSPDVVVLEEVGQLVLEHRDVQRGAPEGEVAVQDQLGQLQEGVSQSREDKACEGGCQLTSSYAQLTCGCPCAWGSLAGTVWSHKLNDWQLL